MNKASMKAKNPMNAIKLAMITAHFNEN